MANTANNAVLIKSYARGAIRVSRTIIFYFLGDLIRQALHRGTWMPLGGIGVKTALELLRKQVLLSLTILACENCFVKCTLISLSWSTPKFKNTSLSNSDHELEYTQVC